MDELIMLLQSDNANKSPQSKELIALTEENKALKDSLINLQSQNAALQESLSKVTKQFEWLKEQLKLSQHRQFAKQSETSHSLQLSLFDDDESDEVTETTTPIDDETAKVTLSRPKKTGSKRNIDTSKLPREQIIHDLSDAEKTCDCGCAMHKIGEDTSEKIDYIPAQLKVIEHVTPKYTCRTCEAIKSAKKPETALPKSMATDNFIVDVILKKYDAHLPLYRQSKLFEDNGIIIPDNTLGNWVMGAADALSPLADVFWKQVSASNYLQADETTVKILNPDKKGFIWAYQGLDPGNRFVMFEFALTRAASIPENRLANFSGLLQTDGYSGYKNMGKREQVIHLGCWDHARRKCVDAIKVAGKNKSGVANDCLTLINKLYHIEREIKHASNETRYAVRQEKAKPVLNALFDKVNKINALPKSTLGKAITYLKNNQLSLSYYIDHGHAQISNCLTENVIRPFALGRKNWLFVGNEESANKAALLYSLIQSCKMNKINARQYLTYVLGQTHAMRRGDVDPTSLLPQFIQPQIFN